VSTTTAKISKPVIAAGVPAAPPLPDELEQLLRRLRLPHIRRLAPEVIATAKAQRWEPAEVLKALLAEEVAGRDRSALASRRISHLAYAPEIAQAMLRRQQASAVVAARSRIVEGAVGMVELALNRLSETDVVDLDEERKASMVSNLMVVLCGDQPPSPIVNTGSLYT
jgi:hypothetical protein